jgi:hypothetical protein
MENFDEFFDYLLENGAVELSALDEDGNPLYSFTEKMIEFAPNLAVHLQNTFHNDMMLLWEMDYLDMDITQDNPTVRLTNKALDLDEVSKLSYELKTTLNTIKQAMRIEP